MDVRYQYGSYDVFKTITPQEGIIYAMTDTHQIFIGPNEYTKGTKKLLAEPTSATQGEVGVLYAYNGNLYLCEGGTSGSYTWTRVANINDEAGTLTSVGAGEGLTTGAGDNPITTSGTISHAIPQGAAATTDAGVDQTPGFGESFNIEGVSTDKFGHVTAINSHSVTLPTETPVSVTDTTGTAQTLNFGDTFTVISGVDKGTGSHEVEAEATTFTLPAAPEDITYTFASGSTEGTILVTPSQGSAYEVTVKDWDTLAKKTDITAIFKFKGTVATTAALPTVGEVGDVYHVTAASAEYVCIQASTTEPAADAVWEELGSEIDLSNYALRADVIGRVSNATGEVPSFTADGQLQSTGFTLGVSVPADAKFTDTTYEAATTSEAGLMSAADKTKLDSVETDADVNVIETVKVAGTALVPDANKAVDVTLAGLGINATATQINNAVVWTSFEP